MNLQTEVKSNPLREWYYNLPAKDLMRVRKDLIRYCGVSDSIFYRWLAAKTAVPIAAQQVINQVAGTKVYDIPQPVPIDQEPCKS